MFKNDIFPCGTDDIDYNEVISEWRSAKQFLNNIAYKTVNSMRDCVTKRNFM